MTGLAGGSEAGVDIGVYVVENENENEDIKSEVRWDEEH